MKVAKGLNRILVRWIASQKRMKVSQSLVGSEGDKNTERWWIFKPDEWWDDNRGLNNALPWWAPFNVFLHCWHGSDTGWPHDHPRWSITIVLRGRFMEYTPTQELWRTPGSIVVRSHKYIHKIKVPKRERRRVYTLFIVGRRRWRQHWIEAGDARFIDDHDSPDEKGLEPDE